MEGRRVHPLERTLASSTGVSARSLLIALVYTVAASAAAASAAMVSAASITSTQGPQQILDRAVSDFRAGRLAESAAGFDRFAELRPDYAPQLWQRGIALYYVGRYQDCREQFESHRTVNPNDVENAVWHFLCVARAETPEIARAALLPVGPDRRAPMKEIYALFRGDLAPEEVMAAAGDQSSPLFYAHLYVGLYFEALGREEAAFEHIAAAANDRYAAAGGYMHMVARVSCNVHSKRRPAFDGGPSSSC